MSTARSPGFDTSPSIHKAMLGTRDLGRPVTRGLKRELTLAMDGDLFGPVISSSGACLTRPLTLMPGPNEPIVALKLKWLFLRGWRQYQMIATALHLSADIDRLFDFEQAVPVRLLPMIDLRLGLCFSHRFIRRDEQNILMQFSE